MTTDAFDVLSTALNQIDGLCLPEVRADGEAYPPEDLVRIDAFVAFAHAEIENYLEELALRILYWSEENAKGLVADQVAPSLITYYRPDRDRVPSQKKIPTDNVVTTLVCRCAKDHRSVVTGNNGIKEESFCEMFMPLGINFAPLNELLFPELDGFGSCRGRLAHLPFANARRREITDPTVARSRVSNLLSLLRDLDTELVAQYGQMTTALPDPV